MTRVRIVLPTLLLLGLCLILYTGFSELKISSNPCFPRSSHLDAAVIDEPPIYYTRTVGRSTFSLLPEMRLPTHEQQRTARDFTDWQRPQQLPIILPPSPICLDMIICRAPRTSPRSK
ncbi:hypothetical protein K402DRAFT_392031 [Aulographum hederae CBS 113979]|uniref:Uncharacterized protein n=1 Tax=Aulographum hederae CBS 113979 TaxID=1176131 RepID=A0A6G1H4X0_9PEZI|nr:hypothetical protein K402DRAFT_392031 [Aulographum hederae CBS 113979]